jgi:hypothetical protein
VLAPRPSSDSELSSILGVPSDGPVIITSRINRSSPALTAAFPALVLCVTKPGRGDTRPETTP